MFPTMILVGLALGLVPHSWEHWRTATAALVVVISLAWGLIVGALLVGTLMALANLVFGLVIGAGLQAVGRVALHRPTH